MSLASSPSPPIPVPPRSTAPGILWPALPSPDNAILFALMGQLECSEWWPPEVLAAHQREQLALLLGHAARTVPLYGKRLRPVLRHLSGNDWQAAFRDLPPLTRADLQSADGAIESTDLPADHLPTEVVESSGSTGMPVRVLATRVSSLFFHAANLRYHLWHGRNFRARVAGITRPAAPSRGNRPARWVPGYPSGPMYRYDVTRPVAEQFEWLQKLNPDYLLTYPVNLRALIELSRETGQRLPRLRQVSTMGEPLDPEVRLACREAWGIPVSDAYSAMETGMIALQCPGHEHYLVQAENIMVEILDVSGRPCVPGTVGRIVITDLHNFATPLIRYEVGDYGEAGGPSPCGRGLPTITRVLGRTRNMLKLPDGEQLWPVFSTVLGEAVPDMKQAQLVQRDADSVDLMLVVRRPLSADEEQAACRAVEGALRDSLSVRLVYAEEIPRSPTGKFEEVKCLI